MGDSPDHQSQSGMVPPTTVSTANEHPLLFNIFINDMYMFMDECTLYNYADDNSLSCTAPTIDAVISNLQLDGNRAIEWFNENGMQANPEQLLFLMTT